MVRKATAGHEIHRRWPRARQALREALRDFVREDSLMVSGSIAFHTLLAIFPMMLLVLGVSGIYIRHFELVGRLSVVLQRYLPLRSDFLMQNLVGISRAYGRIGVVSLVLLLWSSSGVFLPLENALNRAWEVKQGRPWWGSRLLAVELACLVGCLLLISTGVVTVEILFRNWLRRVLAPPLYPLVVFLYHSMTALSSVGTALLAFLLLFQRLPHRPMRFRHAFPGALLTALLWELARWLFTLFLKHSNFRYVYGSIAAVVALMIWIFISSAVILFGAQVSHALYGSLKAAKSKPAEELAPTAPVAQS